MRPVVVVLLVTVVAVVALVRYQTQPPRTVNPNSALYGQATPPAIARAAEPARARRELRPGERAGTSPIYTTPFSAIQVRAVVRGRRLVDVQTVLLSGDGPHTEALNAHAEPILRREVLQAGSPDVDVVSGATYTSRTWIRSLRAAMRDARGG